MTKNWLKPKVISNTATMSVPNDLGVGVSHHNFIHKTLIMYVYHSLLEVDSESKMMPSAHDILCIITL